MVSGVPMVKVTEYLGVSIRVSLCMKNYHQGVASGVLELQQDKRVGTRD